MWQTANGFRWMSRLLDDVLQTSVRTIRFFPECALRTITLS